MTAAAIITFCGATVAEPKEVSADGKQADTVVTGGRIKTPQGWAQAMAIKDGIIIAIGSDAELATEVATARERIDLGGASVFPGLQDMHVHPVFAGLEQMGCMFPYGAPPEAIAARLRECVAAAEPGEWIIGGNWVAAVFAPGEQTRHWLDRIAPDNPVMLEDEAHHSLWVNSRALELAGLTRVSPDPVGGIIEREADGSPNGLLRETAVEAVSIVAPKPTSEQRREALVWASREMLSYGITSYMIASIRDEELADIAALSGSEDIKQRVRGCMVWAPATASSPEYGLDLIARRNLFRTPRFQPDCVKIFLDGVPTESRTAAMLEPYLHAGATSPHDHGTLMVPQEELDRKVAEFDRQGLHIKFHAAGDGAVRAGVDAVAHARKVNGIGGPSHHVGHTTFAAASDFARAAEVGLAIEFSPYIWYPTPIASVDIARVVGSERMERWVPIRDALDSGVLVVAGSDWSVVPSVNPFLAIETMVTRQKPGGSEETLGLGQSISIDEALEIFTGNGARIMGLRDRVGTLEVGMEADFFISRDNLLEMPLSEIHKLKVEETWIQGEKVYDRSEL
ncbi:amidohydrolase [Porphyrobacter sp. TH134]|uniref:amidohydrolase n=1 Tax=Porphyrobacter sp. TH134 TaxID=2067450 RepID=UPI0015543B2C|nr:amidohydrolase [Porphyrobacter sp. TH134]